MAHATAPTVLIPEQRLTMTYEEFLDWTGTEGAHGEWVDGEVIVFMPRTKLHQDAMLFLAVVLRLYVRYFDLGTVVISPFEMRLSARSSRQPDLLFVARANEARLTPERLLGPADLAVEFVSPDSVRRDGVDKRDEYAAGGVAEYWLFDARPQRQRAECSRRVDGRYEPIPPAADGRLHSVVVPGFWLRPGWLWQDPLPDPLDCLDEIAPEVLQRSRRGGGVVDRG